MPIITITVPADLDPITWSNTERIIQATARNVGVQGIVTVWPLVLFAVPWPGRLLLEYKSRQVTPSIGLVTEAVTQAAKAILLYQVEGVPVQLPPDANIHIAK